MKLEFIKHEDIAKNIKSFWFKPLNSASYIAGQYTQLYLPHDNADNRGQKRWFTISSAPSEDLLSITTKIDPLKPSSFKQTLLSLKQGTVISADEPMGDFVLPKDKSMPLIFVAGGIGITPYHSMVKWLQMQHEKRNIHLIYSVNDPEEFAYISLFKKSARLTTLVSQPPPRWTGQTGHLSAKLILKLCPQAAKNSLVFLSGPEPMVETIYKDLQKLGVDQSRLVADYFPGYLAV